MSSASLKNHLDALYIKLNRREYISPDPLQFLYDYEDPADQEVVGLIAASLAYGRVAQIVASVSKVLKEMPEPNSFVTTSSRKKLDKTFLGFKHRFTTGSEMAAMLYGAGFVIKKYGSLGKCFALGIREDHETILPALERFVSELNEGAKGEAPSLLPNPSQGSACKRFNMYLRWMVRKDDVDPGIWDGICPSKLIVPLDTHMHRICTEIGLVKRKSADIKTAQEITAAFRKFSPRDPVRYDFALTRLGIRSDMDTQDFLKACGQKISSLP
jgi:uncharacterized protein (TIGR02757 family)